MLHGVPLRGSPAKYIVLPDKAVPSTSSIRPPPGADNLPISHTADAGTKASEIAEKDNIAIVKLVTCDRFGNPCGSGGLRVAGRLHVIKKDQFDATVLMPNNHSVVVEDLDDGTYAVKVAVMMAATVRLVVNMDKDLPGSSGELPAVQLSFVK